MKYKIIDFLKICCIVLALEVILFNITSYRTFFGKYEKKEFSEEIEFVCLENGKARFIINDINLPISTIKIELKNTDKIYNYNYAYSDETSTEYVRMNEKAYIQNEEKTKYIPCYLSGKINGLIIEIDEEAYEKDLIEKITINERIPFKIDFLRMGILITVLCFIKIIKKSEIMDLEYSEKNFKQEMFLLLILLSIFIITIVINVNSADSNTDNLYNKGLVDAFLNKSASLLQEPTEKFLELENPYDSLTRELKGITRDEDYIWDSAYYNGKFYVYFGVLPVITIFIPYFLIMGEYISCNFVVYVFSIIILILLKEILCKLYKRYFKKVPFKILVYSILILCSGCLIFYMNGCARFYEVAIISGVYCVLQGIFFILKSMESEERKFLNIFFGCLFMALAVACRPILLLCSFLIAPYLLKEFIKNIKNARKNKTELVKFILSIAIPYIIVAIPLMWYNYIRFDNIFEFGAKYQLTINNMITLKGRIFSIPIGLICNLFSIPNFIPDFPFIINHNKLITFYGYYYIENMIGGLFILAPICFLCFASRKVLKKTENKELKWIVKILIFTGILVAVVSVAMAGSTERYLFDYAWMIILAGILLFNIIYQFLKTEEAKNIMRKILAIITVYTIIMGICSGIVSEKSFFESNSKEEFYRIKYSICFWE